LYIHSDTDGGSFNIKHSVWDFDIPLNSVLMKRNGAIYSLEDMVRIYNSMDCLVNVSLQEGLSWTVLEAMLCGTSVIASETTAHPELLSYSDLLVPCVDRNYLPIIGAFGQTHVQTVACSIPELYKKMEQVINEKEEDRREREEKGILKGKSWLKGVVNVNELFSKIKETTPVVIKKEKRKATLFAQKASAGDILMTTQAMKGLKDRHPELPLVYMCNEKYHDILKGNPYIDLVIPWDDREKGEYLYYYNPHEERILPGHWGRNSNSLLADFYWKILGVDPCPMFILPVKPKEFFFFDKPTCVFYSAGADRPFREYQYFGDVALAIKEKYYTIQLGGSDDYPVRGVDLDLRGKLSYREEAYIVSKASLGVTVDTFGSHLCGCFGIDQVTLPGSSNGYVVRPKQQGGKLIVLSPDYIRVCLGLGPCSASIRDCPAPCIGSISPKEVINAISELEKGKTV